jgi:hypothetical protein
MKSDKARVPKMPDPAPDYVSKPSAADLRAKDLELLEEDAMSGRRETRFGVLPARPKSESGQDERLARYPDEECECAACAFVHLGERLALLRQLVGEPDNDDGWQTQLRIFRDVLDREGFRVVRGKDLFDYKLHDPRCGDVEIVRAMLKNRP